MSDPTSENAAFAEIWHRACRRQVKRTRQALVGKISAELATQQARSGMKRTRALLLLARANLGKRVASRLDHGLAGIARALAGKRDLQSMLETLNTSLAAPMADTQSRALVRLRQRIIANLPDELEEASQTNPADSILPELQAIRAEIKAMQTLAPSAADAARRATMIYRKARTAMREAYKSMDGEDFHQWRKLAQRHLRHLELFQMAGHAGLTSRIQLARNIVQLLGEDHDLALIAGFAAGKIPQQLNGQLRPDEVAVIHLFIGTRQQQIRSAIQEPGAQLFGISRKALRNHLLATD